MTRCKHDLVDAQCATCSGTDRTPAQDEALRKASACDYAHGSALGDVKAKIGRDGKIEGRRLA